MLCVVAFLVAPAAVPADGVSGGPIWGLCSDHPEYNFLWADYEAQWDRHMAHWGHNGADPGKLRDIEAQAELDAGEDARREKSNNPNGPGTFNQWYEWYKCIHVAEALGFDGRHMCGPSPRELLGPGMSDTTT